MDVSVIIVNYNTKSLLNDCILSVYDKSFDIDFEVIVVDNASVDGSGEMIRTNFPKVILIESEINLGFGKANNLGASRASGKHLFLLNSDTILITNAIKILSDYLSSNPKVAVCGGNLFYIDHKPATSFSQICPGPMAELDYLFFGMFSRLKYGKSLNFNYTDQPLKLDGYISGADMMIRRDVFNDIKGFDPDFFMYYEETEMTFRIRKKNFEIVSVPEAKIIHLEGASETITENSAKRSFQSKYKYYKKVGMGNKIPLARILYILVGKQRSILFRLLGKRKRAEYWRNLLTWEREIYKTL